MMKSSWLERCWGNESPTVSTCSFKNTEVGTIVYNNHGNKIGLYETEDAAVELIGEQEKNNEKGGTDDAI